MKLRCPLQKQFISNAKSCELTQLYGENKNRYFYGPKGHEGLDFATARPYKYRRNYGGWTRIDRTPEEAEGRIPIVACHDGILSTILYADKRGLGWGVVVTTEPVDNKQYKTIYWHIETPWSSLRKFKWGDIFKLLRRTKVKAGAIIAIGGNNGQSTGPHLHLGLKVRELYYGQWSQWEDLDPMPFFDDNEVKYFRWYGGAFKDYFYKGKQITKQEYDKIS
jgi:hypothetical protein